MPSDSNIIICFGIGMFVAGLLWMAMDEGATNEVEQVYLLEKDYLEIMSVGNNVGPLIFFIIGGVAMFVGVRMKGGFG